MKPNDGINSDAKEHNIKTGGIKNNAAYLIGG